MLLAGLCCGSESKYYSTEQVRNSKNNNNIRQTMKNLPVVNGLTKISVVQKSHQQNALMVATSSRTYPKVTKTTTGTCQTSCHNYLFSKSVMRSLTFYSRLQLRIFKSPSRNSAPAQGSSSKKIKYKVTYHLSAKKYKNTSIWSVQKSKL